MKSLPYSILAVCFLVFASTQNAHARDVVLPAGTLLQCTMSEPNFSSATAAVGDPVLCHLHGVVEFGQQAFPRGSYLVGHLEDAKDPGHFVGKGYLQLRFDRIGLPTGDLPLDTKVIASNGYKVDKEGRIDGKGHAKRDVAEWLFPPLWPWKVIMLPARGPRPKLKGESMITLRLMDDVDIPQVAQTYGPGWHFFGLFQRDSYGNAQYGNPGSPLAIRPAADPAPTAVPQDAPHVSYASYVSADVSLGNTSNIVTLPGMPVFFLTNGAVLSVSAYGYQDNRITYTLASGGSGVISSDDVDWNATTRFNAQRGVRVTLHTGHATGSTPGL
jgi:hypothetical protein